MSEYGFKDPDSQFPLEEITKTNDPDVAREARSINAFIEGTATYKRVTGRIRGIEIAGGFESSSNGSSEEKQTWDEPLPAYHAQYPHNQVFKTLGGMVIEYDDTPDQERISQYHPSGSFEEIDHNGSKITKVTGDKYEIIARNNAVYIKGSTNLTVEGNTNLLIKNDATVEIHGNTKALYRGDVTQKVSGNYQLDVLGNYQLNVAGNHQINSVGSSVINCKATFDINVDDDMSLNSSGLSTLQGVSEVDIRGATVNMNKAPATPPSGFIESSDSKFPEGKKQTQFTDLEFLMARNLKHYIDHLDRNLTKYEEQTLQIINNMLDSSNG